MILNCDDFKNLKERSQHLSKILSQKILVQVEGSTCSGKTTFVNDVKKIMETMEIDCVLIEESAKKIIDQNPLLFNEVCKNEQHTEKWKISKIKMQQLIILDQIAQLEKIGNGEVDLVLMDRGGASTAFFMDNLFSSVIFNTYEEICRTISSSSKLVLLLSPLGFLETANFRYQKEYDDLLTEFLGIKKYVEKWCIKFQEINSNERLMRNKTGAELILDLFNQR